MQVETRECLDNLDGVLSVRGITCAFLGPADMALSLGLHEKHAYNMAAALASPEMSAVNDKLLQVRAPSACMHAAGCWCATCQCWAT